ncbi:MAG: glycosyltransferase family 2 protein [Elusimicrobiota bacterium]|nr:glycosyltransferase family 2 protein [Elusimicrobiota bacterium]
MNPQTQEHNEPEIVRPSRSEGFSERRRRSRTSERFPVTVVAPGGLLRAVTLTGDAKDYDPAGICVLAARPLAVGTVVRVRLHLPKSISLPSRGLPCEFRALVAAVRKTKPKGAQSCELVLEWEKPLPELVSGAVTSYKRKIAALVALVLALLVWTKYQSLDFFWFAPVFYVYSLALALYLLSRFYISWRHRAPPLGNYTPSVSIVISVRNEEHAITRTVETCFETDYPSDKREVLVVNDGSTDGTLRVLKDLQKRFPELQVFSQPPTGKRAAMAQGVKSAKGEIITFVDSDTFLFRDALRHIVCGFEDPTLGASAGYTEVENCNTNALTGLQEIRYYVSFRLLKASEGFYAAVTCCPGCLSAYRRKYVLEILDPWRNQRFLGAEATFGDDRSLTNFILRKYRVIYNDLAVASTLVPDTWGQYLRQQLRWKKSWLRETLIAASFMYKKHPVAAISFYASSIISVASPAMAGRVAYLAAQGEASMLLPYLLGLLLIGFLQSLYFLHRRPSPHWLLGMLWMGSALFITGPQTYYAVLTMRKNHWGTR